MGIITTDTTLDKLKPGEVAYIDKVNCGGVLLRHFSDMGLVRGTCVRLEKGCFAAGIIIIRLRGYSLALRRADAELISVSGICRRRDYDFEAGKSFYPHLFGAAKKDDYKFALAGVPNCGKTTLFNLLTGENRRTGNFPGVTVERKDGEVRGKPHLVITDLPGISSLSPYSSEETVTRNYLLDTPPDCIINIVNVLSPHRSLYLTLQLAELDIPMVIALNMMDEVRACGGRADALKLEKALGIPVVPVCGADGEGTDKLLERAVWAAEKKAVPGRWDFYGQTINKNIADLSQYIAINAEKEGIPLRFAASKAAEKDELVMKALELEEKSVDAFLGNEGGENLALVRYAFVEHICSKIFYMPEETTRHTLSLRADKLLAGKYTSIPVFAGVMALIFYITFAGFGSLLSEAASSLVEKISGIFGLWLWGCNVNPMVCNLVTDGIFAGIGCVIGFFPIVAVLFLLLSVLEDCGYMARAALITDNILRRAGLSGKSFVPLFLGLGCSVPAVMAVKTLPSEHDRRLTALLIPFISCSAKLPVFMLFASVFFREYPAVVITGLYLAGIIASVVFSVFYNKTTTKSNVTPFIMELPDYRMPMLKNTARLMWDKGADFVTRAFTVIFLSSVIVWLLKELNIHLRPVVLPEESLLAHIGGFAAPLFQPLGFGNWRAVAAVLCGIAAKENIVSTLTVLSAVNLFTVDSAASFLVFCLLYTPCIAAVTAVKNEFGLGFAIKMCAVQFAVAWVAAFLCKIIV